MSIDINYHSFSPSIADTEWPNFIEDVSALRQKYSGSKKDKEKQAMNKSVLYNLHQDSLYEGSNIGYLVAEKDFNENYLLRDLKMLDLYYGSVESGCLEDSKAEYYILEALVSVHELETEERIPTKKEWIRLFENISNEGLQKTSDILSKESGWGDYESWEVLMDYLRAIRPVVKNLKETPDAVFVRMVNLEDFEPENSNLLITERAKKHVEEFKGMLPPVL